MASSSSSAPQKEFRPYEVFISFRGEDTRNNFVSHLHSALKDRGIRTYFDQTNLQTGQTIGPELIKAIQESSVAIVVLSTNYGSSTWCLNELLKIMECKNKSEIDVFPIFYDVDPSDVRKQKNTFFKAFSEHEANFKDNGEIVKIWRDVLKQIADLAGEDIRGKNEAFCIKEIVDKILSHLPLKASGFRNSCVGIESRISDIKKLMDSKPNEVFFIGLWGMGGIGKTTTARAIFEDCHNNFDGSCFLQDVKERKNKIHKLQKNLLSDVLNTKFKDFCDVIRGSSQIKERLQFKKVLLVIDDVDDIDQLDSLAGHPNWFGGGSRIIITTRDANLLNEDHIEKYDVQTLPRNEALHLFCLHAFKNDYVDEDFKELSLQVLSYVAGLPLALQVLGRHLHKKDKWFWEDTLKKLKKIPNEEIISTLKISFDGLDNFHKEIFLDIACFFRGYSKVGVEERLESLGIHPKEGIDVLIQKSLITIDSSDTFDPSDTIEMHDLLQEMGWYIIRERCKGDIRKYTHLWLEKHIDYVLSDITVSSEAERIYIPYGYIFELGWERAFGNMNKLRFLEFSFDIIVENNEDVDVYQSVGQLFKKLCFFCWDSYPGQSLPKSFHPITLVQLRMGHSALKETPDFSHMPNLEVLNLSWSFKLVHVHPSLGDHLKIKHINLERCKELKEFPRINQMKSLEILNLKFTGLQNFPEIYGKLDSLRRLRLNGTRINGLPKSILGNATCLENLKLASRRPFGEEITCLAIVAKNFPGLVCLTIKGSGIVRTLDFSHLPYLKKLNLSNSKELKEVHDTLGVHKSIKDIDLSCCSKLEEFPRIGDMNSLEFLNLIGTSLQRFPEIYGKLDSLKILGWTRINGLAKSILGNATRLPNLESLVMSCRSPFDEEFTCLAVVAKSFPGLVFLTIERSGIVRTLDFTHLPYLELLNLSYSEELIEIHPSLGVHKRIKSINLSNCSKLEEFPRMGDMNSLQDLDLSGTRLQCFPEITGNLNNLVKLNLDETEITTLPWSIGRATRLKIISMEDCDHLLTLPISFFGPQIETVYISSRALKYFKGTIDDEVAVLEEVEPHFPQRKRQKQLIGSEGIGQLPLAEISFSNCTSLEELPGFLLSRVNILIIKDSPTLISWICLNLVYLLDKFQHLCHLQLHQRDDIVAFSKWDSMSDMLRKREKYFEIHVPGRKIPSWFQYKFSTSSMIVFLPPLSEWYTDKFRGFVLSGINADVNDHEISISGYTNYYRDLCCCPAEHVLVMCIPIDNIRGGMTCSDGQKVRTLFELLSMRYLGEEMVETSPRWGLSLLYSEGEVIELDPDQVMIVTNNDQSCYDITFKVCIGESRDKIEELYSSWNPISLASFQQQTQTQVGTSAMEQDLSVPQLLHLFPSGPDLKCYQEGEPSSVCYGKDGDSELELDFSLDSHMMI